MSQAVLPGLLEREEAFGALAAALGDVRGGNGRLALVTGEAGVGKTALIERFCADQGGLARMLRGACDSLFTPQPLGPIQDVAHTASPALAHVLDTDPSPYQVATTLFDELDRDGPTVLVVEDVHWADEATLDVFNVVTRRIGATRALIVLTYRDEEVDTTHPLRRMLGELVPRVDVTRVRLEPLSPEAVAQLAERYSVDADGLHRITGGNPFFVTEVLASGEDEIPATVRDAVLARAARLTPAARGVLEAVSIATPRAELWLLEALSNEIDERLDECLASGMLVSWEGGVAFRHELARLAVEGSLSAARRLHLHRSALEALTSRSHGDHGLARIAHHAEAAGDREAVLSFARRGGRRRRTNRSARRPVTRRRNVGNSADSAATPPP